MRTIKKYAILLLVLLSLVLIFYKETLFCLDNDVVEYNTEGTIYVGDSRFVGMNKFCELDKDDNKFVVAKVGEGYNWLVNTAEPKINNIMLEHPEITTWHIIFGLGVNDLGNIDKYVTKYSEYIANDDFNVYVMSVNPVEYHKTITNETIEQFNTKLKNIENVNYIDTYTTITKLGYKTVDGLHFDELTYSRIYNIIKAYFSLLNKELFKGLPMLMLKIA